MPLIRFLLSTFAVTALAHAMHGHTTVYWTGNGDRWGGSPHTKWSLSPEGTDYFQVTGGASVRMHYDLGSLEGSLATVLMNRQNVAIHSLVLTGVGTEGFVFDTAGENSTGILMAGPLAVVRGEHRFENTGLNVLQLAADATWNIAPSGSLTWKIPLDEDLAARSLIKQGGGLLRMSGNHLYTGPTHILGGAFGSADGPVSLAGGLIFGPGARFLFDPVHTVTVAGGVSFAAPFGVADLKGLDASVPSGSYLLIAGPVNFANLANTGAFMAAFLADGRRAYFEDDEGLRLHVAEDFPEWPLPLLEWEGFDHGHPVLGLHGAPGVPYTLQTSANLSQWLTAEILNGPAYWTDPSALGTTPRFYRAQMEDPRPGRVGDPSPANHAPNAPLTPVLSWTSGAGAHAHDVYFGTDRPGAFMGSQTGTSFDPGPLLPNTTYYWRVDPRHGNTVSEGEVWSFSTPARPSAVSFVGAGAPTASTGPITLALPEGLLPGDILITFLHTSGPHIYLEDTAGGRWLSLARNGASPQSTGSGNNEVHLTAYYSRYNGTQSAPTTNDSGDHQLGVILAFRGVVSNGVPWDAVDGNTRDDSSTDAFVPGAATSVPNTLVVGAMATALPDADGSNTFSGWSPRTPGMTNLTERVDVSTAVGNGGALGIATADFAPAGVSYGRINVTLAVPSPRAMFSAALRPEVLPGLVDDAWPVHGAGNVGITAQLRWTASPNAATREVFFGTTSPGEYQGSQTTTTFDPGPLLPHTTYYWRVNEKNPAGTTIGVLRSFTTGPAGGLPQLVGMTADNAAAELAAAGAQIGTLTRVFSDTVAPGVVISQNPPVGSALQPGMAVDLIRSRGPESGVVVFPNGPDFLDGKAIPTHRNVSLVTSKAGTLLAFAGHRPNGPPDEDSMQIHLRRSTDGGETWGPAIAVAEDGMNRCATQVAMVLPTGRILLLWLWNEWIPEEEDRTTRRVFVSHSDDDGITWSEREITSEVYESDWRWYGLGPGNAFVKQRPPHAGRLIIPARHGRRGASGRPHIIYSDDGGETFQLGGTLDRGSESTAAELSDGAILFNVRLGSIDHRYAGLSSDGGLSFPVQYTDFDLPGAGACQASLLMHSFNRVTGQNNILFSNPDDLDERINGTIKLSELDGAPGTWTRRFRYSAPAPAFSAYSDITVMNEAGDIGILWEFGSHYSKPARWDGGVKFRAITFDQINEPIP